jgi:DNA-binding CsgD family transcriptional regulator
MHLDVDVRHVLPDLQVPTLILHRANDLLVPVGCARYMARRIPGACYRELAGPDHLFWLGDQDRTLGAIREFLAKTREGRLPRQTRPAPSRQPRARPTAGWQALTQAELDVVCLVVEGLTNREIGQRLFVSPRTVQTHLAHVFDKLALRRRSELAAMASHRFR